MLEVATIRKLSNFGSGKEMISAIIDAILYYGRVHLYIEFSALRDIALCISWNGLLTLLNHTSISATIITEDPVIHSEGLPIIHTPLFMSGSYSTDQTASWSPEDRLFRFLNMRSDMGTQITRKQIQALLRIARPKPYSKLMGDEVSNPTIWKSLATDPSTIKLAANALAKTKGGIVNQDRLDACSIKIYSMAGEGVAIDSSEYLQDILKIPDMPELSWAHILAEINEFRLDMYFSANEASDLILNPTSAMFASSRVDLSLNRSRRNIKQIENFNETIFENGKPLGELFTSGKISLRDALRIIDKAENFRSIIKSKPQNADLLQEYISEISKTAWLDTAPNKAIRLLLYTGISIATIPLNPAVGLAIGTAAGAFDSFLLPKIVDAWKPNVFVQSLERHLKS